MVMEGFDESVKVVVKAIKELGPFDGILTFSQGSSLYRYFTYIT